MLRRAIMLAALILPASMLAMSCGGNDKSSGNSSADGQAVEQAVRSTVDSYNNQDIDGFLAGWTDNGLQDEFQASRDEIKADAADFIGGPPRDLRSLTNTKVNGAKATTDAEFAFSKSIEKERYTLISDGGTWKIDAAAPVVVDIPSGTTAVDIDMKEFAYDYDATKIKSGNIAFKVDNVGKQAHELILLKVPAGFDLNAFLQSDAQELPAGVEVIGGLSPKAPNESANLVFTEPLASGNYEMVCFLPDTSNQQGTPHVLEGMSSQFTVPAQGGNP